MKAREVVDRLFSTKGVTPARIEKAKALAQRSGLQWSDVLDAMNSTEREMVEHR